MGLYYLLTVRVAPSPNREDFLVFLVILVVLDILYLTWGAGFHPEDSSSPSTCAFFSKNPRIPRTKNYHTKKGSAPTLSGGGYTFTGGDNAVYGILSIAYSPRGGRRAPLGNTQPEIYGGRPRYIHLSLMGLGATLSGWW